MSEEEINQYANWLLSECNDPIDEIEWLISNLSDHVKDDIKQLLKILNQNKDE